MGVPVIGRVNDVRSSIREGDLLLLDAAAGQLHVRPTQAVQDAFDAKLEISQKRRAGLAALRDLPAVTRDGVPIELMINAGLREDVAALDLNGPRGLGLFRNEFQFLVSATAPSPDRLLRPHSSTTSDARGIR